MGIRVICLVIKRRLKAEGGRLKAEESNEQRTTEYVISNITIRKRGREDKKLKKRELRDGEMEIGFINGKYKVRAKNVDINELIKNLATASIGITNEKIVVDRIDKKVDFEGEEKYIMTLLRYGIFNKLRPKIYNIRPIFSEWDRKGNLIKEGYIEVTLLSNVEIQKRREKAQLKNAEGERLMKQGRYLEALQTFESVPDPDDIKADINLGKIYLLNRQYSKAIDHFNVAIEIDSTNDEAWLGLSEAYEKGGQIDKALESMQKYVSFSKDTRKVEEVKNKIESLKDNTQGKYYLFVKKGDEYKSKHDINKAKEQYDKAININSKLVLAYRKMAELYESNKEYSKAEKVYQTAVERDKENFELYLLLSNIKIILKKNEEAIKLMEKAKGICPVKITVLKIDKMIESVKQGMKNEK